jgi:hypothetical protein
MAAVRAELLRPGLSVGGGVIMVFGTGGAAGRGAGAGLLGVDAALTALGSTFLAEEDGGDFETGLTTGFAFTVTGLATGFITDLVAIFFTLTSLVVDFLGGGACLTAFLTVTWVTGLAVGFNTGLETGFTSLAIAAFWGTAFTVGSFFLAMAFTSSLLWALACG